MEIKEVIERVSRLRTRAKLSARALSNAINKAPGYINLLEKKGFELSLSALFDIIEACNSTPEEFFYSDIESYKQDKQTLEFIKTLSPHQKDAIMNLYKK